MKKLTVAISASCISTDGDAAPAAEIYNKDSNKLDLYGKVNAKHYFSCLMMQMMVILLMPVLASKVNPNGPSTTDLVSGNINSKATALNLKFPPKTKPVLHLQA
ncbi:hypothetical protein ACLK19_03710 [Escherichia coli]